MTAEFADDEPVMDPPAPAEFRRAMGMFASGVTVITGLDGAEPVGFTCQAFASVSLRPPLILFCADHRGRSWPRIRKSGRFCVHVLGEDQVDLCDRFGSSRGKRYEGLRWRLSRWGAPVLDGVLLRVHAEVADVHVAGDHDVVIGRVLQVEPVTEQPPMIFYRGKLGLDGERRLNLAELSRWSWSDYWG